ncbi:hypothetical protein BG004_003971 [Podila humilis]|nr:hypothetical protein BG004_003971 [Podila humilis]
MGVFGEKHTSLTREQKRQLINHADTHKLRPTEVCDWVLATWGLRIARVTVYSILHKQRASLMAGHRDLYQSMQNSINGAIAAASGSAYGVSTNTHASSDDSCLDPDKSSGRVSKGARSGGKGTRGISGDLTTQASTETLSPGEGARWEGQLKRVREPASVELDRAMVEFLKSSASVDAHGRRLNDAELQSHALRLARGIPSASRMRCSFGWLRHFKRRLGVQWAADRLGRYRWIVEMDHSIRPSSSSSSTPTIDASSSSSPLRVDAETQATSSPRQDTTGKEQVRRRRSRSYSQFQSSPETPQRPLDVNHGDNDSDEEDDDLEYHSSSELFGKEADAPSSTVSPSSMHTRSSSTSTSSTNASYTTTTSTQLHSRHAQDILSHNSTPSSAFAHQLASQPLSTASLAHPAHSTFLNLHPTSLHSQHVSTSHHQQPSILDSFPSLFDSLPALHSSHIPTTVSSSQLLLNNTLASSLANPMNLHSDTLSSTPVDATNNNDKINTSQFGMSVDGGMRKVPSKDEAYDMLQSLLLYYEQDHHFIGEQQTLLLPRWIHQQRQIMHSDENDSRMMWMRQQQQQQQPSLATPTAMPSVVTQSHHHHHHHAAASSTSSPPLSPLSPLLPMSPLDNRTTATSTAVNGSGLERFGVNAFPSLTSTIEHQMFFAHQHALQQQFALHQQHQQQQQQQRQQQQQSLVFQNL